MDVSDDFREIFLKMAPFRITTLISSINSLKQKSKYVVEYFLELKFLWEERNFDHPLPMCTCYHRCYCDAIQNSQEYRLEDQVIQFLRSMNDTSSIVKTQVLLMDLLPSINRIYSIIVQE